MTILLSLTFGVSGCDYNIFTLLLEEKRRFENGGHSLSKAYGQESSAADAEDIDIDEDRFMSFCIKFKYLGTFFVLSNK
jgi:hypothetical protein